MILCIKKSEVSTKKAIRAKKNESVNLQDTRLIHKNLLLFYALIMNHQKEKARKSFKRMKYLGIHLTKKGNKIYS